MNPENLEGAQTLEAFTMKPTYSEVRSKIMLRHPREEVKKLLKLAIDDEDAEFIEEHERWQITCADVQKRIEEIHAFNAANPGTQKVLPQLPKEPVLDLSQRQACYEQQIVDVDFEISTQSKPLSIEYDDEALVALIYPLTHAYSDEEVAQVKRARFKQEREDTVAAIKVEVDGLTFDGDELAQNRMSRAVLVMDEGSTLSWVLADNSTANVTKSQLIAACKAAILTQTQLWTEEV
ncbi:hypothetical protein JL49_10990 [Pseudoalteromonas luteoviolacea]|nr:hypothetical protein JL49_10990 [Pseudoalteromonas luteoviolacea]